MNEILSCNEIISKVFSNIEANQVQQAVTLSSVWKEIVRGIKNTRDEFYGEKIAAHSEVVDLKNGQLLIETDHSGWIQVMQLHSKFIIRGINMKLPDVKISSLVFRMKGSDAVLFESYEESLERAKKKQTEKEIHDEKILNDYYKKNSITENIPSEEREKNKENLPPEFLAQLASLKETVLTNSKE